MITKQTIIFNTTKEFPTTLSIISKITKNKSDNKLTNYLDKLYQTYDKQMFKLNRRLGK